MTAQECREKRQAAGRMLVQASRFERQARTEIVPARVLHLRGRALQARGSAWVLHAEVDAA